MGWFYQEYDRDGRPVVDHDSMFTPGFGRGKLLELLKKTDAPAVHLMNISLDLDPGEGQ
jgi:hypothetical protein